MESSNKRSEVTPDEATQTTESFQPHNENFKSREDYFLSLQKWINDAQLWQNSMSCMPYFFLSHPELFGVVPPLPPGYITDPSRRQTTVPTISWSASVQAQPGVNRTPNTTPGALRYKVPPYWKRFCAEVVDSVIMFTLKLLITFIAIHVFGLIDLDKYSIEMLQQNVQSLTYKVAVEMTSQILVLELVNRIVVCLLEAYWLRGGEGGMVGGSSPGKNLFGLRVVLCYQAHPVPGQPNEVVSVTPGTDLGWGFALTRSLSKNVFLALIYPLCFAFFFFKFNRLGYDVMSYSIVVESVDHNNNRR
ncbi:protein FAM8A1 [Frankliniella occidentalis]|uniref:Protein FAM8A1 n=1 Tax=Frankliniella occidentalis TaxID=133901 RepID=A0A6J1SZ82_FRAOC|nr:protein FAM8A1 [Frankliniella occidentalis]